MGFILIANYHTLLSSKKKAFFDKVDISEIAGELLKSTIKPKFTVVIAFENNWTKPQNEKFTGVDRIRIQDAFIST